MDERVFGLMEAAEWHQKAAEKATQELKDQIGKLEKMLEKLSLALNALPQDFTQVAGQKQQLRQGRSHPEKSEIFHEVR